MVLTRNRLRCHSISARSDAITNSPNSRLVYTCQHANILWRVVCYFYKERSKRGGDSVQCVEAVRLRTTHYYLTLRSGGLGRLRLPRIPFFPCGGAAAPPHGKKKGDWRAASPPNLPNLLHLRKVSYYHYGPVSFSKVSK